MLRRMMLRLCPQRKSSKYFWLAKESEPVMDSIIKRIGNNASWESKEGKTLTDQLRFEFNQLQFSKIDMKSFNSDCISYVPLIEEQSYTIAMFFLPLGKHMPFHDHPNQTVFQRVLSGEISVEACDNPTHRISTHLVNPKDKTVLVQPTKNNIHRISANNGDALFVDLVVPPYNDSDNQICYFEEGPNKTLCPVKDPHIRMNWIHPSRVFI